MDFLDRINKWARYTKENPWQGLGILVVGGIAILLLRLSQRQVEVWEDEFLEKHGTNFILTRGALVIGFMSRHPVWSMVIFAGCVLLGMIVHAYIVTHPFRNFEQERDNTYAQSSAAKSVNVELIPSRAQSPEQFLEVVNKGKKQKFTAQCRILDLRNDPNPTPHVLLDLMWYMRPSRKIEIASGESCNLLIAEAGKLKDQDGWVTE